MRNPNKIFGAHYKVISEHLKIRLCSRTSENKLKKVRKIVEKFVKVD
jgi:hypothetical protein